MIMTDITEKSKYDVLGIGSAVVDIIASVTEAELIKLNLAKGSTAQVDLDTFEALYDDITPEKEYAGGACVNTLIGLTGLGVKTAYIGKVKDDPLGELFVTNLITSSVEVFTEPLIGPQAPETGRCLILLSADGTNTNRIFLGASNEINESDIAETALTQAGMIFLEGFVLDNAETHGALLRVFDIAQMHKIKTAFNICDLSCVERSGDTILKICSKADIVIGDEAEIRALYPAVSLLKAVNKATEANPDTMFVATMHDRGAMAALKNDVCIVRAEDVSVMVDKTGSGDLFAAGFLYGYIRGMSMRDSIRVGHICAAESLTHKGSQPEAQLLELIKNL
jgi:sugar/nucleoside kinase (ribokinase family)